MNSSTTGRAPAPQHTGYGLALWPGGGETLQPGQVLHQQGDGLAGQQGGVGHIHLPATQTSYIQAGLCVDPRSFFADPVAFLNADSPPA